MPGEAEIRPGAIRAALIGNGIEASLTPALHMAEGAVQGLDYVYDLIDTATTPWCSRPLGEIIAWARAEGFAGLNITHPHKREVLAHVDEQSGEVERIGAANTVVFQDERAIGHNTDCPAFARAFSDFAKGKARGRVLLLGAGGAGSAVAFALMKCNVGELVVHDSVAEHGEELAARLHKFHPEASIRVSGSLDPAIVATCDGVVNATPVGMDSHPGTPIPPQWLHPRQWLADIIYFPHETALLAAGRRMGCACLSGAEMAIWQAVFAFGLITSLPADPDRMRAAFGRPDDEGGERGG